MNRFSSRQVARIEGLIKYAALLFNQILKVTFNKMRRDSWKNLYFGLQVKDLHRRLQFCIEKHVFWSLEERPHRHNRGTQQHDQGTIIISDSFFTVT